MSVISQKLQKAVANSRTVLARMQERRDHQNEYIGAQPTYSGNCYKRANHNKEY